MPANKPSADYDLQSIKAPRLEGRAVDLAARAFAAPGIHSLVATKFLRDAGVLRARAIALDEAPSLYPDRPLPTVPTAPLGSDALGERWFAAAQATEPGAALALARAYRQGGTTPEQVAEKLLAGITASDAGALPLKAFISVKPDDVRAQAKASADRHRRGAPLSALDGVPVAVKDEIDQAGHATTLGTKFRTEVATRDATLVARLRAAGALLIGKANMHEIGINPSGVNETWGQCRNPHSLLHDSGGSSSGSAAAVAAGLCPISIGADGGGSIRIPAAHCGVVGLKATFGRISEHGVPPLCWSVGHVGPIGATVQDVALAYAALGGADPAAWETQAQPAPSLARYFSRDALAGVRVGVCRPWFEHASADIVRECDAAVEALREQGARIVEVSIAELDAMRVAHAITILSEMAASVRTLTANGGKLGAVPRVSLAIVSAINSADFVWAQRMRTRALQEHARVFTECDVIATPSSAITAPPVGASGQIWSDLVLTTEVMRYIIAGNFLGYPAISVPVGRDSAGLPIGLQLMGRHWEEDLLLGLAASVERARGVLRAPARYELLV